MIAYRADRVRHRWPRTASQDAGSVDKLSGVAGERLHCEMS
jgi:hypothetical protein